MRLLSLLAVLVFAQARQNLTEYLEAELRADQGFEQAEREALLAAMKDRFAAYSYDVVNAERKPAAEVALRMVVEGSFDRAAPERIADVAFAAYTAVRRGAPAEVVEGIALYGYQKPVPADTLAAWANGYRQLVDARVPPEVAADLVRNAMQQGWDDSTFNTLKWALVNAGRDRFNTRDYAVYLFGHMQQGAKPGALTAKAQSYFRGLRGAKPQLPPYDGVFEKTERPTERAARERSEAEAAEALRRSRDEERRRAAQEKARQAREKTVTAPVAEKPAAQDRPKPSQEVVPRMQERHTKFDAFWPGLDQAARSYLGVPYVWGGETKKGIDCSALTRNSYRENDVTLPRVSRQQWETGKQVTDLREGDLVFFNTRGVGVSHVGMMVDRARFIHASSSRGVVIDELGKKYYKQRYLGARRVVP